MGILRFRKGNADKHGKRRKIMPDRATRIAEKDTIRIAVENPHVMEIFLNKYFNLCIPVVDAYEATRPMREIGFIGSVERVLDQRGDSFDSLLTEIVWRTIPGGKTMVERPAGVRATAYSQYGEQNGFSYGRQGYRAPGSRPKGPVASSTLEKEMEEVAEAIKSAINKMKTENADHVGPVYAVDQNGQLVEMTEKEYRNRQKGQQVQQAKETGGNNLGNAG